MTAEDMSLQEHDLRYHDNNYRGGKCLFRERMGSGDDSDGALNDANEKESVIYGARRFEAKMVENAIMENFKDFTAKNSRIQMLEPDKEGNNRLMVWCGMDIPDGAMDEGKFRKMMKGLGYDTVNYSIMEEKPQGQSKHRAKPKKLFVSDVKRQKEERVEYADPEGDKKDKPQIRSEKTEGGLDDERKSRLLKQFGVKSEGGSIRRRTEEDAKKDRIRKYLGIMNDFGSGE